MGLQFLKRPYLTVHKQKQISKRKPSHLSRAFLDSNFRRTFEPKSGLLVPESLDKRPYDTILVSPLPSRNQNRGPLDQLLIPYQFYEISTMN
jgi:hypothetical protein